MADYANQKFKCARNVLMGGSHRDVRQGHRVQRVGDMLAEIIVQVDLGHAEPVKDRAS